MLLMWEVTSAADAKGYYASSLNPGMASERLDYYMEGQESAGRYGGKLAERLGLAGNLVDSATFDRLCDNLHPTSDESLTLRTNAERRVCYDLTFSGPKSFSIMEALAGPDERQRLLRIFDEAIEETVAKDIEPDMQTRVRKDGADFNRRTGNLLWAAFDHATARPDGSDVPADPHRHKHLLVWNATYDQVEGKVKAAQLGDIVRDQSYYRAAFYSRLASKLESVGYAIDRRQGTDWEVAGVPQSLIDRFSKRTARIEAEAEKRGITNPKEKAELGAKIRSKKQKDLTLPELRDLWKEQMDEGERSALADVFRKNSPVARRVTARDAVQFAIAHCSEQLSVVPERELKRVALLHGLGSLTPSMVEAEMPRQGVIVREFDGRRMATTKALQQEESRIVGFAARGRGAVQPVGLSNHLKRGTLNDGQWQAVSGLLQSANRVNLVEGPAGAGKSTMLKKFDEGMRLKGQGVTYLATTTDAAGVLGKDGFEVSTVARFLLDEKLQETARGGHVVVDEASMLGHKDAFRLFQLADQLDAKLICVGDPMQHGSVPRGALMRILKDYGGVKPFQLTEIMRQERTDYREAAKLLSEGRTLEGFDAIDQMGWVKVLGDEERYQQIAADYLAAVEAKKSVLVISPTHAEAALCTEAIRGQLRAAGRLGSEEREFTTLVSANATEAERGQLSTYRPGDVLVFHQNAKGIVKGERLKVGDASTVPLAEAAKFQLYREETIRLAVGDQIRFTATVKTVDGKHKLANGAVKTIESFDSKGNIRLDNGWTVSADAGHFRHGFVETSFGSQGKTVQRTLLAMSSKSLGASNQEQLYVSSSRSRESLTIFTDDKAAIRQAVQRSSQKLAALDMEPVEEKRSDPLQQHRRRHRFYQRLRAALAAMSKPLVQQRPKMEQGQARREEGARAYGQ